MKCISKSPDMSIFIVDHSLLEETKANLEESGARHGMYKYSDLFENVDYSIYELNQQQVEQFLPNATDRIYYSAINDKVPLLWRLSPTDEDVDREIIYVDGKGEFQSKSIFDEFPKVYYRPALQISTMPINDLKIY